MAQLRVHLLGSLDVEGIDERDLGSRKARTLVKVLALARGVPVPADAVVEALWPGEDLPAKPVEQVGVLVSRLRAVLGADRVTRSDAGWALNVDWLDVAELEARVDEAAARLAAGSPASARAAAAAALALTRGELLADEPDPVWAEGQRAAVQRALGRARLIGADAALSVGDNGDAALLAEGALDHDPYDEAALRVLMRAHADAGRPASALAAYARMRERLAEDLGVDPVTETEELHTAILLGEVTMTERSAPVSTPATLAGRGAQLDALDALLERARHDRPQLAMVVGEAGIGKTTLVSHWLAAQASDVLVISGRCDELGRDLPLQPLFDGLAAHLRTLGPAAADACLADAAPLLGPLLGAAASTSDATTVHDPATGRALLFAALLATVERAAAHRTVVVVVEDVHLAGETTLDWLRFAARRGSRLLALATARPPAPPLAVAAATIELGPLDLADVALLVGHARAEDLHARSGGHPLFLLELCNTESAALPSSIRESVADRVDALGDAAATLRAAAILGTVIDVDVLAGVVDRPVAVLLEHLDAGVRSLLIEERAGALNFRHDLVREALAADTTAARRAFVHREAARVLRGRPGHDPMEAAWHARAGGDIATAIGALVDAAAVAVARYDMAQADQLLTDALSLEDTVAARAARGRVRIARFDLDAAEVDAARAIELGGGAGSFELAGWVAYYKRDYGRALQRAEEGAARADDAGVRASCLTLSGRILHASGHLEEAGARLTEAVATAPVEVRGVAQVFLGGLLVHAARVDDASELVDRAMLDAGRLAHPFAMHHGHLFRVLGLGMRGLPVEALAANDAAMAVAVAAGEGGWRFVAVQDNLRSWLLRRLGHPEAGDDCTARTLELRATYGSAMHEMYYAACLDRIDGRLLIGDAAGAAAALEHTRDVLAWNGSHAWHHHQRFRVLAAEVALAHDDPDTAAAEAAVAIADAGERGASRYGFLGAAAGARAALAAGEPIDKERIDAVLAALDRCAGLEAWRVTAELAAAAGDDRWWRDADRRAGALVAQAGEHSDSLRRAVVTTFSALGR